MNERVSPLETYGHFSHRPLAEAIARKGGLLGREGDVMDQTAAIDPLELAAQRGARMLAISLLDAMGWRLVVQPPVQAARAPRQTIAETDT